MSAESQSVASLSEEKLRSALTSYIQNREQTGENVCSLIEEVREQKRCHVLADRNVSNGGNTVLHAAAVRGDAKLVKCVLSSVEDMYKFTLLNQVNRRGNTPISNAATFGHVETLNCMLTSVTTEQKFAIFMGRNASGMTILSQVAERGNAEVFQVIIGSVQDVSRFDLLLSQNKNLETAVILAAQAGHVQILQHIMEIADEGKRFDLLNMGNAKGQSALHRAAWIGHLDIMRIIMTSVNSNQIVTLGMMQDKSGNTCLHEAAFNGHSDAIAQLLHGFNPSGVHGMLMKSNRNGETALHRAASQGHNSAMQAILNAVSEDQIKLELLMSRDDTNGDTPISLSARNNHQDSVRFLLNAADLNTRIEMLSASNANSQTPLHICVLNGGEHVVEIILDSIVDHQLFNLLSLKDDEGLTPLVLALFNGHMTIIQKISCLLDVDVNSKESEENERQTASDLAEQQENNETKLEGKYAQIRLDQVQEDVHHYSSLVTEAFIEQLTSSNVKVSIPEGGQQINSVFTAPSTERENLFITKIVLVENQRITDWIDKQLAPVSQIKNMVEFLYQDAVAAIYAKLGPSEDEHVYTKLEEEAIKTLLCNIKYDIRAISLQEINSKIEDMGAMGMSHREKMLNEIIHEREDRQIGQQTTLSAFYHPIASEASGGRQKRGRCIARRSYSGRPPPPNNWQPLMFHTDEVIELTGQGTDNPRWWFGSRNGVSGYFPSSNVMEDDGYSVVSEVRRSEPSSAASYRNIRPLREYPWYVGKCSKSSASDKLWKQRDGVFLVRDSENRKGHYAIGVTQSEIAHHLIINQTDERGYTIDKRTYFGSIPELIQNYKEESFQDYYPAVSTRLLIPYKEREQRTRAVDVATATPTALGMVYVHHDFVAREANQISLQQGEMVIVFSKQRQPDGLWRGAVIRNGHLSQVGYFPIANVREVEGVRWGSPGNPPS